MLRQWMYENADKSVILRQQAAYILESHLYKQLVSSNKNLTNFIILL